jgi:DNA-binding MarR family transcriptional regulator
MEQSTNNRDHADIRLWLRLLYCTSRIETALQSKLTAEFGMSLARFDLLAQLERAPNGLTMTELSRQMMVSNGATTSLVDRLAEDGLLQRAAHPSDRRTTIISLTDLGRARFLEAKAELLSGLGALKQHLSS